MADWKVAYLAANWVGWRVGSRVVMTVDSMAGSWAQMMAEKWVEWLVDSMALRMVDSMAVKMAASTVVMMVDLMVGWKVVLTAEL